MATRTQTAFFCWCVADADGLRFDAERLKVSGEAMPVLEQVRLGGALLLNGALSVSDSGVLVYQPQRQRSQLVWVDRRGKELAVLGDPAELSYLQLSPNGRHAAVTVQPSSGGSLDLWLYDTVRGGRTRITADPADETSPIWAPDSERLAFLARRPGDNDLNLYQLTLSTNAEERLLATSAPEIPTSWSPDSRFIVYQAGTEGLWILPISGDRKPSRSPPRALAETGRNSPRMGAGSRTHRAKQGDEKSTSRHFSGLAGPCRFQRTGETTRGGARMARRFSTSPTTTR